MHDVPASLRGAISGSVTLTDDELDKLRKVLDLAVTRTHRPIVDVAREAGISRSMVHRILKGAGASYETFKELGKALGVSDQVEEILSRPGVAVITIEDLEGTTWKLIPGRSVI